MGCPGPSSLVRGGEWMLRTRWQLRTGPGRPPHPPDARPHAPAITKGDLRRRETYYSCPQRGLGEKADSLFLNASVTSDDSRHATMSQFSTQKPIRTAGLHHANNFCYRDTLSSTCTPSLGMGILTTGQRAALSDWNPIVRSLLWTAPHPTTHPPQKPEVHQQWRQCGPICQP